MATVKYRDIDEAGIRFQQRLQTSAAQYWADIGVAKGSTPTDEQIRILMCIVQQQMGQLAERLCAACAARVMEEAVENIVEGFTTARMLRNQAEGKKPEPAAKSVAESKPVPEKRVPLTQDKFRSLLQEHGNLADYTLEEGGSWFTASAGTKIELEQIYAARFSSGRIWDTRLDRMRGDS